MSKTVLILGARAPVAVDIARAFDAAGCQVHLADSVTAWAARWSRVGRGRVHRLPSARFSFEEYANQLAGLVSGLNLSLVIPTCEEVFYVSAAAQRGGFEHLVFAPSLAILRTLHSKVEFAHFARSLGLAAPETWAVKDSADLEALPIPPNELVFKPEYSRFGTATILRPAKTSFPAIKLSPDQTWAAQRFVEGEEICLWSAVIKGRVVASVAYRPRWRVGHAASYAFEAFEDASVTRIAQVIASATGMTGHLSFDIILTKNGDVVPIECNPRAVSGLHLFDGSAELARAILGVNPVTSPTNSLRFLSPAMVLLGAPHAIISNRWQEFINDWRRGIDALGRPGDRLPAAGALVDVVRFALIGLTRLRSPAGQTTDDIEWNGDPI